MTIPPGWSQRLGRTGLTDAGIAALVDRPHDAFLLSTAGIPVGFCGQRYRLDEVATVVHRVDAPPLLRFGTGSLGGAIGLDLPSGRVIEIFGPSQRLQMFINSSLGQFVDTIGHVVARFPYYGASAEGAELDAVADDVLRLVGEIDADAVVADRFWSTFVDDMRMGDMSTEAIEQLSWETPPGTSLWK